MTTFRYTSSWQVKTKNRDFYRVVTDSQGFGLTLGEIRELVAETFRGFGIAVDEVSMLSAGNRYVRDSKLHPSDRVTFQSVVQRY